MKISMKEFEEAKIAERGRNRPLDQKILDFLREDEDFAHEISDIIMALKPDIKIPENSKFEKVMVAIYGLNYSNTFNKLEKEGKIQKTVRDNEIYYAIIKK